MAQKVQNRTWNQTIIISFLYYLLQWISILSTQLTQNYISQNSFPCIVPSQRGSQRPFVQHLEGGSNAIATCFLLFAHLFVVSCFLSTQTTGTGIPGATHTLSLNCCVICRLEGSSWVHSSFCFSDPWLRYVFSFMGGSPSYPHGSLTSLQLAEVRDDICFCSSPTLNPSLLPKLLPFTVRGELFINCLASSVELYRLNSYNKSFYMSLPLVLLL